MKSYTTHKGWGIKKPNQAGLKYKVWPGFRFFCMKKGEVKKTNWIGNWLEKTQNLVHYKHLCSTFTSSFKCCSDTTSTSYVRSWLQHSEVFGGKPKTKLRQSNSTTTKEWYGIVLGSSTYCECVLHAPRMLCQHKKPLPLSLSLSHYYTIKTATCRHFPLSFGNITWWHDA